MNANIAAILYLVSGVLFILSLRGLSSPATSQAGARNGMIGMAIAIATTLWMLWDGGAGLDMSTIAIIVGGIVVGGMVGAVVAQKIKMTAMPQLVAFFHSLVGLAAVLVAAAALYAPKGYGIVDTGAAGRERRAAAQAGVHHRAVARLGHWRADLHRLGDRVPQAQRQHVGRADHPAGAPPASTSPSRSPSSRWWCRWCRPRHAAWMFWALTVIALVLGITLIIPIGGADMPVVVSMLNSYSGWAAAALGFTLENNALIITGSLVGSSGAILSYIMCKAMNRSFISVILGGFGGETAAAAVGGGPARPVKIGSADDAPSS
jgi:NAD(P) transhydrogenase subunit beta